MIVACVLKNAFCVCSSSTIWHILTCVRIPCSPSPLLLIYHPSTPFLWPFPFLPRCQHVGQGFPLDWFTHTFNRLSVAMSFLALAVGPPVTAAFELAGGPLGPFKISLLLVGLNGLLLLSWRRDSHKPCPACADVGRLWSRAFSAVVGEGGSRIALVAVAQGCFEAATFAFALLWTPLLTRPDVSMDMGSTQQPPWGMVFSQQLVSCFAPFAVVVMVVEI